MTRITEAHMPAWLLKQSTVRKGNMGPGRQRVGEVDGEGTFPTFNGGYELVPPSTITVSRDRFAVVFDPPIRVRQGPLGVY